MKQILIKIALFLGYCVFASWSAYMTATSIHLKWLGEMPFVLAFIMIFVISLVAGWCLTNVIKELKNTLNPSKTKFIFNLLGFLLFWGFSFITNVHYSVVTQHGYDNLNRQIHSCVVFLQNKTDVSDAEFQNMVDSKKNNLKDEILALVSEFHRSIEDTRNGRAGFGDECISKLNQIENTLTVDTAIYQDHNKYVIFDEVRDAGDRGVTAYNRFSILQDKYDKRINECLNLKYEVINRYYIGQKVNNESLVKTLTLAENLESKALPQIKNNGDFKKYYQCYEKDVSKLLGQMPQEYFNSIEKFKVGKDKKFVVDKNGNKEIVNYVIYPSDRMFDFVNVWKDWFNGVMPDYISVAGKMPLALMFDVVAFILICLI